MATVIKLKRSTSSSSVPTTSDLTDGEVAVNIADKKIYARNGGSIVEIANVDTSVLIANDANNRIVTADGSSGLNGEANLTFDGSVLATTGNITATGTIEPAGDTAAGDNAASPTPTPILAKNKLKYVLARPHKAVIKLHNATPIDIIPTLFFLSAS